MRANPDAGIIGQFSARFRADILRIGTKTVEKGAVPNFRRSDNNPICQLFLRFFDLFGSDYRQLQAIIRGPSFLGGESNGKVSRREEDPQRRKRSREGKRRRKRTDRETRFRAGEIKFPDRIAKADDRTGAGWTGWIRIKPDETGRNGSNRTEPG